MPAKYCLWLVLTICFNSQRLEARDAHGAKKSKITRDRERDVTEKVALGMAQVDRTSGEAMYDTRLFNQEKGLATGFGDDESYNLYDKPLFAERGSGLYKMKKTQDSEIYGGAEDGHRTERFKASQGFQVCRIQIQACILLPCQHDASAILHMIASW